ncbi:MAG: hypothetical protein V3T05_04510, partial [Myxococcota bacterium]
MSRLGIRTYLFVALGVMATLPGLWLGTRQASRLADSELRKADERSLTQARTFAREIAGAVNTNVLAVELLASRAQAADAWDPAALQALVTDVRRHTPGLSFAYIADAAGVSIVADPPTDSTGASNAGVDYSDRDYYISIVRHHRTALSRVQIGRRSGVPNVQIAAPILDGAGKLRG